MDTLRDAAALAVEHGKSKGAGMMVAVYRRHFMEVEYRERKLEKLGESTTMRLSAEVYVDGRYSTSSTSDLRPAELRRFLDDVIASARHLAPDPFRELPDPSLYAARPTDDLEILDRSWGRVTPEDRKRKAAAIEAASLAAGGSKVISVTAGYYDEHEEIVRVHSNGFEGRADRTSFWMGSDVTVRDEKDKKPVEWWWPGVRLASDMPKAEEVGRIAAARALQRIGSGKIGGGTMAMLVEGRAAGRLVGWLLDAVDGGAVQQKRSFLEGKIGSRIGSGLLTLVDEPLRKRGLASRHFDSEGISARRLPVFEDGVLKSYFIDTYYSRKLKLPPTTRGTSNLVLKPGSRAIDDMVKDLGRGILVTGILGGNSNSTTGDFSCGVQGYLVDKGAIARPVSEMNIAGNHLTFWSSLAEVGRDPYPYSSYLLPPLRFDAVTFAGA